MTKYTEEFQRFWKGFPARWNRELGLWVKRKKKPAFSKWQKLPQKIRDECMSKLRLIKKAEGGAIRDAVTWLNQEGWDDIELPEQVKPLHPQVAALADRALKPVPKEQSTAVKANKQVRQLLGKAKR